MSINSNSTNSGSAVSSNSPDNNPERSGETGLVVNQTIKRTIEVVDRVFESGFTTPPPRDPLARPPKLQRVSAEIKRIPKGNVNHVKRNLQREFEKEYFSKLASSLPKHHIV